MCSGDPLCLLNIHSKDYGQISARSWWPTSELEWETAKPYSYWDSTIVGLQTSSWSNFPKAGGGALIPAQLELGRAEVLINFPSITSHRASIKRYLATGGSPPPPPTQPESSWGGGRQANYGRTEGGRGYLFFAAPLGQAREGCKQRPARGPPCSADGDRARQARVAVPRQVLFRGRLTPLASRHSWLMRRPTFADRIRAQHGEGSMRPILFYYS